MFRTVNRRDIIPLKLFITGKRKAAAHPARNTAAICQSTPQRAIRHAYCITEPEERHAQMNTDSEIKKADLSEENFTDDKLYLDDIKPRENAVSEPCKGIQNTPYTGRIYNGNIIFISNSIEDAQSIEKVTDIFTGAMAIDTMQGNEFLSVLTEWSEQQQDGTAIISLDNTAEGKTRATELLHAIQDLHIKCITSSVCGKYSTPEDAAANDPEQFKQDIAAALHAAKNARLPDALDKFLEKIQGSYFKPYTTGVQFLDEVLNGGVMKQTLTMLIAAPGTGKTTLMQQAAEELAEQGTPVIYLNLEMSQDQMLAKALSGRLAKRGIHITANRIMQGYSWTKEDREHITQAITLYRQNNLANITYKGDIGSDLDAILEYINAAGRAAKEQGKAAPVVFLDYLHLVTTDKRHVEAQELIKQTVTGLKRYAIDYDAIVFAISAASREAMKTELTLNSARDSSNIEYTADNILTLEREEQQEDASDWQTMTIKAVKARYGRANEKRSISFCPAYNYFSPVAGFTGTGKVGKKSRPEIVI